jgi:hypothetical protein
MKKLISVCGIIAFATIAAACSGRETTTVRRETVQTVPADPVIVEKKTTTRSGTVERRTTETIETDEDR